MKKVLTLFLMLALCALDATSAFLATCQETRTHSSRPLTPLYETRTTNTAAVEDYLKENHSTFWRVIMSRNDAVWKKLRESGASGVTVFAPTDEAMAALGEQRLQQLQDIRNEETVLKMGAYHVISEPVLADKLFDSAGVIPVAGNAILVERSVSGGFFGVGGKEDGGVTVGGARVLESVTLGSNLIHRTDTLVSPNILWRYCDQLRIPGSK